jgi:simple sugar transport system permease protein
MKGEKINMKKAKIVPIIFIGLSLLGLYFSKMEPSFVLNEVMIRFIRDGILVLALIIPITAGMGINFAITIGAICAQVGILIVVDGQIKGTVGIFLALIIGISLALVLGYIIGVCLNKVKGKEMIATIIIGFLGTSIYQLIFMVGYGTVIKPHNKEIILSTGIGVRNMVDLVELRDLADKLPVINIGEIQIPIFMIAIVLIFALMITYILNSKLGKKFKIVGENAASARILGIDVDKIRVKAIVISTVLACIGQMIFIQNIGMLNVYTAHMNIDIFSSAALLTGGATIRNAKVRHAFIGIFLFHTLFIVSPQAGQNIFNNASLGEYFRSFIAYGTIAFAIVMYLKSDRDDSKE